MTEHEPGCPRRIVNGVRLAHAVCVCDALRAAYKRGWEGGETETLLNTPCSSCRNKVLDEARAAVMDVATWWEPGAGDICWHDQALAAIDALRGGQ